MGYVAAAAGGGVLSRKIGFGGALLAAVAIELIGVSKKFLFFYQSLAELLTSLECYQRLSTSQFWLDVLWILDYWYCICDTSSSITLLFLAPT